jgi:hypothetical protein
MDVDGNCDMSSVSSDGHYSTAASHTYNSSVDGVSGVGGVGGDGSNSGLGGADILATGDNDQLMLMALQALGDLSTPRLLSARDP